MHPLAIAHRGYHKVYYENTKEAFLAASKMDFYGIETDIHLTKDLVWVTHHNDDIVSNGQHYFIKDLTLEEIMKLPLDNEQGHKNATVCLFSDYLSICIESGKRPFIEIKNSPKWKHLKKLGKYVDEHIGLEHVTFIGFYPWPLGKLRLSFKKRITIQHLIEEHTELLGYARLFRMGLDVASKKITPKMVEKFHKKKLPVNVWTVDDKKDLRRLEEMGVDFITSNEFDQNA